jgi:mycoredoxin
MSQTPPQYVPGPDQLTVISAPWCGACTRIKSGLTRNNISFVEVNIDDDPVAEKFAAEANGGDWLIPTVLFPDGSVLVNPGINTVRARLADLSSS